MSLITLAQHVRGQRAFTRTLLIVIAVTGAVIVGLLAMHSLNTHTTASGHGDTVAVAEEVSTHHDAAPLSAQLNTTAAHDDGCGDCGDDHAMAWIACVLALLVSVLVLARHRIGWRITVRDDVLRAVQARWPAPAQIVPPPSLTVLCISRT